MSYSNGVLGWGSEITTSEKNVKVEQVEPVFLYTGDFINDTTIVKFTSDQKNAVTSDSSHFSITNNEIVVNKSGIYKIYFTTSYKISDAGFVPEILKMVSKPIRKS